MILAEKRILNDSPEDIHFYFYPDRSDINHCVELPYNIASSIPPIGFSWEGPTRFLIHGYYDTPFNITVENLKDAFLESPEPGNIILVDWTNLSQLPGAALPNALIYYPFVLSNLPIVADKMAKFILNYFANQPIDPLHVHLLGHSLGAHVAGYVGDYVRSRSGVPIAQITGLDPAGPLFEPVFLSIGRSLSAQDAVFVDVIHTNAGLYGQIGQSGHADFYPNGGTSQPGCLGLDPILAGACKHRARGKFYLETSGNP